MKKRKKQWPKTLVATYANSEQVFIAKSATHYRAIMGDAEAMRKEGYSVTIKEKI